MVGQNQIFVEGASINRPPLFTGENYPFWKVRMQIFLLVSRSGMFERADKNKRGVNWFLNNKLTL